MGYASMGYDSMRYDSIYMYVIMTTPQPLNWDRRRSEWTVLEG